MSLQSEHRAMKAFVDQCFYGARRYFDGRSTYATSMFNNCVRALVREGLLPAPEKTSDGTIWARDGMGRAYDGLTDEEAALGEPVERWVIQDVERQAAEIAEARALLARCAEELSGVRLVDPAEWAAGLKDRRAAYDELKARMAAFGCPIADTENPYEFDISVFAALVEAQRALRRIETSDAPDWVRDLARDGLGG